MINYMNSNELSMIYLSSIKELLQKNSNESTNVILADTYLKLIKSVQTCCSNEEEIDPIEIISLGTIVYHFKKNPL